MSQHLRTGVWASVIAVAGLPAQASVNADDALRTLMAGNRRFVSGNLLPQPLGEGARRTLARGQAPYAIVVTTTDSRVVPEHIFNVGLGELYVVRVAGNVCDQATLASIEYAAEVLGTNLCLVLGHDQSTELADVPRESADTPGLARIAARLRPALQRAESEGLEGTALLLRAAQESTYETIEECLRRSAVLRELTRLERFKLVPALYALASGEVSLLPARPSRELTLAQPRRDGALRPKQAGLPPHVAMSLLQAGHRRFLAGTNGLADLSPARRQALTSAQRPYAIVLTDADSRLAPEHVFDAGLGEIAVVRVAGCTLDDEVLGSIEHLVREFGSGLLLVVAPDQCGITEFVLRNGDGPRLTPSLRTVAEWLQPSILEARHQGLDGAELVRAVVQNNVLRTVREIRLRSPMLRAMEQRGQLGVLGAVYRLVDGEIEWLRDQPSTRVGELVGSDTGSRRGLDLDDSHAAPAVEPSLPADAHGVDTGTGKADVDGGATEHDAATHGATTSAMAAPREERVGSPHAPEAGPKATKAASTGPAAVAGGGVGVGVGSTLLLGLLVAIAGVFGAYAMMQTGGRRATKTGA